jgi:hypothetical protein
MLLCINTSAVSAARETISNYLMHKSNVLALGSL